MALKEMQDSGLAHWGPKSFQQYCKDSGIRQGETARFISVDSLNKLRPELRAARCMVFRLGIPAGERNTHFALASCGADWDDYFLQDHCLFGDLSAQEFIPTAPHEHLLPFRMLPNYTET